MRRGKSHETPEAVRREAVRRWREGDESAREVGIAYGVTKGTIQRWYNELYQGCKRNPRPDGINDEKRRPSATN